MTGIIKCFSNFCANQQSLAFLAPATEVVEDQVGEEGRLGEGGGGQASFARSLVPDSPGSAPRGQGPLMGMTQNVNLHRDPGRIHTHGPLKQRLGDLGIFSSVLGRGNRPSHRPRDHSQPRCGSPLAA